MTDLYLYVCPVCSAKVSVCVPNAEAYCMNHTYAGKAETRPQRMEMRGEVPEPTRVKTLVPGGAPARPGMRLLPVNRLLDADRGGASMPPAPVDGRRKPSTILRPPPR